MAEVRPAGPGDVAAIRRFGETHVRAHYAPLIGAAAQVRDWWNETHVAAAVAAELVVVAEAGGEFLGGGRRSRAAADRLYIAHFATNAQAGALTARNCQTPAVT
ncbi:hypothetical protein [Amycolatopsis tolypomycina]|uniref:hypothetical protein n=1 Tax=Amycolatopsis tolypomycina TaxID=208445 RepID=UPI0033BA25C5